MELCRKFIGKLCTIQNEELEKDGGSPLFNNSDFMELINNWTMVECSIVASKISYDILSVLDSGDEITDDLIMPWCIVNEEDCDRCKYASRHGQCSDSNSEYRKQIAIKNVPIFSRGNIRDRVIKLIQLYHTVGKTSDQEKGES